MTLQKRRAPLTLDAALARIAGQMGDWAEVAKAVDRSESLVRAWGDPHRRENIPLIDAITLDLAYRDAGGIGSPFFETTAYLLDQQGMFRFANEITLGRLSADVIRECGEATAHLVMAAQPGSDRGDHREALIQVDEAIDGLQRARVLVATLANGGNIDTASLLGDPDGEPCATGPPQG
jgi:hypothetical protein